MKTGNVMKTINVASMIALVALTGCSGFLQKNGGLVRWKSIEDGLNVDPDTGLAFRGVTTVPTLNETLNRIETVLQGTVSRQAGNFQTAVGQAGTNLFTYRDPYFASGSGVLAIASLAHSACASIGAGNLGTVFGVNTAQTVAQQATNLENFGLRILANATGVDQNVSSDVTNQARAIFNKQIADLRTITTPAAVNTTQAAISVCTAAIVASFRLGS